MEPPLLEQGRQLPLSAADPTSNSKDAGDLSSTNAPSTDEKTGPIASQQDASDDEYPSGIKLAFIVLGLILAIFLPSLDLTIVATAIPKITDEFGGLQDVSWYGAAFFLTNGAFQSSWGKVYRYFPLKWTFLASLAVFELGSVICGAAPSSVVFIIGRAISGLGAAGIGTGAYTIVAFSAPPSKRARLTSFIGMAYGIASVLGPLIGGLISDYSTWRWCFYLNLPVGAVTLLFTLIFFHAPAAAKPVEATWREKLLQTDPAGVALFTGASVSFVLAFQYGGVEAPWSSGLVVGLIVGFVALYALFGAWEHFQGERSMLVPRLVKVRSILVSCIYTICFSGAYYLMIYYLPIYFQSVGGVSPTMSGVRSLPLILGVTFAMILSGVFVSATGIASPIMVAGAAITVVATGLMYTFNPESSTGQWIGYQLLGGIGWGISYQLPIVIAQNSADPSDISTVTAMVLFSMNLGSTSFVSAGQSAFVNTLINSLPSTAPGVDPLKVIRTGATEIRTVFRPEDVPGIVEAYMAGIHVALALPIAATGLALVVSLFSRWNRLPSGAANDAIAA